MSQGRVPLSQPKVRNILDTTVPWAWAAAHSNNKLAA